MSRYSERPCPGCGDVARRAPQTLCQTCRRWLELGKRREQEIATLEVSGERIGVAIDCRFAYDTKAHISFLPVRHYEVLEALVCLARLEDARGSGGTYREARKIHFVYSIPNSTRPRQFVWAMPGQADAIELVLDYIQMVIGKAYSDGFAEGRSLIRHLAMAGVEDINRMTTGEKHGE